MTLSSADPESEVEKKEEDGEEEELEEEEEEEEELSDGEAEAKQLSLCLQDLLAAMRAGSEEDARAGLEQLFRYTEEQAQENQGLRNRLAALEAGAARPRALLRIERQLMRGMVLGRGAEQLAEERAHLLLPLNQSAVEEGDVQLRAHLGQVVSEEAKAVYLSAIRDDEEAVAQNSLAGLVGKMLQLREQGKELEGEVQAEQACDARVRQALAETQRILACASRLPPHALSLERVDERQLKALGQGLGRGASGNVSLVSFNGEVYAFKKTHLRGDADVVSVVQADPWIC